MEYKLFEPSFFPPATGVQSRNKLNDARREHIRRRHVTN